MMSKITEVFELVDATSDEMYYPLGMYLSLEDAIKATDVKKDEPLTSNDEFERVEVRKREIGFHGWRYESIVFTLERESYYDECDDEYYWRNINITVSQTTGEGDE
jgi:hypothetical protein